MTKKEQYIIELKKGRRLRERMKRIGEWVKKENNTERKRRHEIDD